MEYCKIEIIAQLNTRDKKISSNVCKVGDRFIFEGHSTLLFKTNHEPKDGNYLCCDESGNLIWLNGNLKVNLINGVAMEMNRISKLFKKEILGKGPK